MRSTKCDQANVERALHSGVWGQNEGKFEGIECEVFRKWDILLLPSIATQEM